jgi:dipeptidyl-peptidase-4
VITRVAEDQLFPVEVRRADGSLAGTLASVAAPPAELPRVEIAKVGGFWTTLVRPRDFDPKKKYAVLVDVYAGPGIRVVHRPALAHVKKQWLADHGFIVVSIDGRGTPGRGSAWERAIYQDFAGVPLDDQVAGLQALAEREPAMDLSRVGIWGGSFGGYMAALAVMRRPDVFHAAVAISSVADWLDYDTYYTERYLGVPDLKDTSVYDRNGLLGYAKDLSRPLLLIHGTADDNVFFTHTLRLADALFRAGKRFELIPMASTTHSPRDPALSLVLNARIFDFFRENLR